MIAKKIKLVVTALSLCNKKQHVAMAIPLVLLLRLYYAAK